MENDKGGYRQISKSLNICAFDDYLRGQTANVPTIPDVEQLSPRVLRILGQNPGKFTFQGTNTYVVGTGTHRLIIDTSGGEPEWAALIEKTFSEHGISLSHVLVTHWHGDHQGGVPDLVFVEEENALFTGDNILGTGTSAVEDLGTYITSLQKMQAQNCTAGYSAHGVVIDNLKAKIQGELTSKLRREKQIMKALSRLRERGITNTTTPGVVAEIYGDSIDEATRTLALEPFIDEVLQKLAGDGRVAFHMRGGVKSWYSVEALQLRRVDSGVVVEKRGVEVSVQEIVA